MAENDPPSKKDFFISYNKADREWAEWIAWHLEESGHYSVDIQAWDFGPGCNFVIEMDRAIQRCDRVVAVLSPDYLSSLFTQPEWAAYFAQDPTGNERRIVSVRIRECELKGLLAQIVFTDLVGKPENEGKAALLDGVKLGRRKPDSAPGFPGRKVLSKPRFPGALPEIWNVPHLRNPNFTEPGQRLTEMRNALRSGKPAALTQALAGLGGVGKTQLAIEYAYRYAADYTIVWWLRSEQPATLAADYATLATALDLPEKDITEQPVIVTAVREVLRHRQEWLLIFDNANAMGEVRPFLPQSRGHVLITSRNPSWRSVANPMRIEKWPVNIAVEFLLKRTGQTDDVAAKSIAEELDHLPLALEQAGAYIEVAQIALERYLALFRERRIDLLKRGQPSTDYPDTVATTWELAFQQLEKDSPAGVALLQLCAFLAPDDIPRDVIVAGAEHLPEPLCETVKDGLAFDDAVSAIIRYSLIDASGRATFSLHRLVQAVIRDRVGEAGRKQWAATAVQVVNKAFPEESDDVRTWKECDRLLPHALASASFAESLGVGLEAAARLINQIGAYSWGRAEYSNAKVAFERALEIVEKVFGPDHPAVAIRVNNLGLVRQALGDLPGAKAAFERALKINEEAFGPDHPKVAIRINNLGGVLQHLGDLSGAKAAFERALAIDEKAFGPSDPEVAADLNNLGLVLRQLGDFTGAKVALERALAIDEKAFDSDHPKVATNTSNLGLVLQDLGDLPGARAAFERALKIGEETLGLVHPTVAVYVNNLGCVLRDLSDFSGAKAAFERALEIDETILGPDHPEIATDIANLGRALKGLGDLSGARTAFERALRISETSLGKDHPRTRAVRQQLDSLF